MFNKHWPETGCTAIVPIGSSGILGNTLGLPRYNQWLRHITYLTSDALSVFVGLLLGDAHFFRAGGSKAKDSAYYIIGFTQSLINFPFVWHTILEIFHCLPSIPKVRLAKGTPPGTDSKELRGVGWKDRFRFDLRTRALPVFSFLADLFILPNGRKGIKVDLFHYLTPKALAFWIMCDGHRTMGGLSLCTDSYTIQELVILINILIIRYDLKCTIHKAGNHHRIYISADSMAQLRTIVGPHMSPFSMYKLAGMSRKDYTDSLTK